MMITMTGLILMDFITVLIMCLLTFCRAAEGFPRSTVHDINIHKCYCSNGHVWDKRRCVPEETFVPLLQIFPWSVASVNSKEIKINKLSRVRCNSQQLLVPLKAGSFYVVGNGQLFHLYTGIQYSVDEYCIEHVFDKNMKPRLDGLVCVSQPQVSRCCPDGYVIEKGSMACVRNTNATFYPSIYHGPNIYLNWNTLEGPHLGIPQCEGTQISYQVSLERNVSNHALLKYDANGIFLQLSSPVEFSLPELINPLDYCVGVEERNSEYHHSAFYCDEPAPLDGLMHVRHSNRDRYYPKIYILPVIFVPIYLT